MPNLTRYEPNTPAPSGGWFAELDELGIPTRIWVSWATGELLPASSPGFTWCYAALVCSQDFVARTSATRACSAASDFETAGPRATALFPTRIAQHAISLHRNAGMW
jgi:hypothetical protein